MASVTSIIDSKAAICIATKFLEQHHCVILADAALEGNEWVVTAKTGVMLHHVKHVKIEASTGRITQCA